jgi:GNAT superfamily N-acetyltransferase
MNDNPAGDTFRISAATEPDVPLILQMIRELARYEKLEREVVATLGGLRRSLFGNPRYAEVLIGREGERPVAFALYCHNYSTFLGRPGLYLEDLFVRPAARGRGHGRALLEHLAALARERNCGRMEWQVLDWNESAMRFYERLGARAMSDWTVCRLDEKAISAMLVR